MDRRGAPDSFIVRDATVLAHAHFYFRESKGLIISDLLTKAGGKLRQIAYQKDATVTRIGLINV